MIIIEITGGVFYNTLHPTATPSRPIKIGDVFEVDSIDVNGRAIWKARYGNVMKEIGVDAMYWSYGKQNKIFDDEYEATYGECNESAAGCTCDIIVLMSVGCKCGWIEKERSAAG